MVGLVTMLVSTLGATGMGSILKIAGGLVQSLNEAREKKAERELARDLAISGQQIDFQKATFGETDASTAKFYAVGPDGKETDKISVAVDNTNIDGVIKSILANAISEFLPARTGGTERVVCVSGYKKINGVQTKQPC